MRAENIPINYKTQTASTSVKVNILPSKFPKVDKQFFIRLVGGIQQLREKSLDLRIYIRSNPPP